VIPRCRNFAALEKCNLMGYTWAWVEPSMCAKFPVISPSNTPPASTRITRQKCNLMGYTRAWIMPLMCAKASNRCRGYAPAAAGGPTRGTIAAPSAGKPLLRRASRRRYVRAPGAERGNTGASAGFGRCKRRARADSKPPLAHARGYGKNFKVDAVALLDRHVAAVMLDRLHADALALEGADAVHRRLCAGDRRHDADVVA